MLTELTIHKFKSWSHETLESRSPWDDEAKVSDDFLTPLFKIYFKKLSLPNFMNKKIFVNWLNSSLVKTARRLKATWIKLQVLRHVHLIKLRKH